VSALATTLPLQTSHMFNRPGFHIGDTWYFVQGERAHMYYLTCPDSIPRHTRWSIGHAWSDDLVHWQDMGVVLKPGLPDAWDGICPATGSVIEFGGRYWMAYTGNFSGPRPATGLAVSEDLFSWQKWDGNPVTGIDGRIYSGEGNLAWRQPRWRDPFLFRDGETVYQLITAALPCAPPETAGTVALACSRDMENWEILPPLDLPEIGQDLECPKLHLVDGRYYLTLSVSKTIMAPGLASLQGEGQPLDTAYSLVSDNFEGPYVLHGNGRVLEEGFPVSPYACEPVRFRGKYHLLGTLWDDEQGDRVCDPIPLQATSRGWKAAR